MVETVVNVERTTTTQTTTSTGGGIPALRLNFGYFTTPPGICKVFQFFCGILCLSLASPALASATHFFLFVAVIAFIGTILWSVAYFLGVREALNVAVNWILTELLNTVVVTILYFIAMVVQLTTWTSYSYSIHGGRGSNIAAGVFGLFNFLAYLAGAYLLYLQHRSGATF